MKLPISLSVSFATMAALAHGAAAHPHSTDAMLELVSGRADGAPQIEATITNAGHRPLGPADRAHAGSPVRGSGIWFTHSRSSDQTGHGRGLPGVPNKQNWFVQSDGERFLRILGRPVRHAGGDRSASG